MAKLDKYDIEVLEMLNGDRPFVWGAWVGEVIEGLRSRGLVSPMPYKITPAGRQAISEGNSK